MSTKVNVSTEERGDFVLEVTGEEGAAINDFLGKNPHAILQIPRVRKF